MIRGLGVGALAATTLFSGLFSGAVPGQEVGAVPGEDDARALIESFDAAWAAHDLDRLMAPVSPFFGCELYGDVNASQLRETYELLLLGDLGDTRSSTHVLDVHYEAPHLQVFTCRTFSPTGRPNQPVEELCHVYYLKPEREHLAIVGLEEYDHRDYECLRDDRYEQSRFAFSFTRPEGFFAVPVPDTGAALAEVVLRGDGLRTELRLLILQRAEPIDLVAAFDADLQDWMRANPPAKVETRRRTEVAGLRAQQAVIRYSGSSCRLAGTERDVEPRRSRRVYVALDERHLLTLTLIAPRTSFAAASDALDGLLESLEIDLDDGATYTETIENRNGWGHQEGGFFACPDSGLFVQAPEGFDLELTRTGAVLSLRASPTGGGPTTGAASFQIDCVPLLDPDVPLTDLIAQDDRNRTTSRRSRQDCRVGDLRAVRVDRELPMAGARARMEKIVYVRSGRHVVTIRVAGTPSEVESAQPALDSLLEGISIHKRE